MARKDLLYQGRAGSRHADNQDRQLARAAERLLSGEEFRRVGFDYPVDLGSVLFSVRCSSGKLLQLRLDPVRLVEMTHRLLVLRQVVPRLAERKMKVNKVPVRQTLIGQQQIHPLQQRSLGSGDGLAVGEGEIGESMPRLQSNSLVKKRGGFSAP